MNEEYGEKIGNNSDAEGATHKLLPKNGRVNVYARVRPALGEEVQKEKIITVDQDNVITVNSQAPKSFAFDRVFSETCSQKEVFDVVASSCIDDLFTGYHSTIFVYGQTGTGKTYTISNGEKGSEGIIHRSLEKIFQMVQHDKQHEYSVFLSYVQIYMETLHDLLNPEATAKLAIREDPELGIIITGCQNEKVNCVDEALALFTLGNANRMTALTKMNASSSRSHACLIVTLEKRVPINDLGALQNSHKRMTRGRLHMVDLAGSERSKKTEAVGIRRKEAAYINLSLTCLGLVINALISKKSHIPYRDSKLTRLLRDSLGGSGKTSIVVTIGPAVSDFQETLSTLNFGQRAMRVQVQPRLHQVIDYKALSVKLQHQLDTVEDDHNKLKQESEATQEEKEKLNTQLTETQKLLHSTKMEKDMLEQQLRRKEQEETEKETKLEFELRELLEGHDSEVDEYQAEIIDKEKHISELAEEKTNLETKLSTLQGEHSQLKEAYEKLQQQKQEEYQQLTSEKSGVESKLDEASTTITQLKEQIEQLNKQVNQLYLQIEKKDEEIGGITKQRDVFIQQNKALQTEMQDMFTVRTQQDQLIESLNAQIAEMKQELSTATQKINELTSSNKDLISEKTKLESECAALSSDKQILQATLTAKESQYREDIANEQDKSASLAKQVAQLEINIEQQKRQYEQKMEAMELKFQSERLNFETTIENLKHNIEQLNAQHHRASQQQAKQIQELQTDKATLTHDVSELKQKLEDTQAEAKEQIQQLKDQFELTLKQFSEQAATEKQQLITKYEERIAELEAFILQLQAIIQKLQATIATNESTIDDLKKVIGLNEQEISRLKSEIENLSTAFDKKQLEMAAMETELKAKMEEVQQQCKAEVESTIETMKEKLVRQQQTYHEELSTLRRRHEEEKLDMVEIFEVDKKQLILSNETTLQELEADYKAKVETMKQLLKEDFAAQANEACLKMEEQLLFQHAQLSALHDGVNECHSMLTALADKYTKDVIDLRRIIAKKSETERKLASDIIVLERKLDDSTQENELTKKAMAKLTLDNDHLRFRITNLTQIVQAHTSKRKATQATTALSLKSQER